MFQILIFIKEKSFLECFSFYFKKLMIKRI